MESDFAGGILSSPGARNEKFCGEARDESGGSVEGEVLRRYVFTQNFVSTSFFFLNKGG